MTTATKKCTGCKKRFDDDHEWIKNGMIRFHSAECLVSWSNAKEEKEYLRQVSKAYLNKGAPKIKTKTRQQLFQQLQKLVNRYILKVRDAGKGCFTCGTTKPDIQYHAGHRFHAGAGGGDRRRFMHENIHKQCVRCNNYESGAAAEYDRKFIQVYGEDKLKWLENVNNHLALKEKYPDINDIKREIERYRRLLRASGLEPNA